MTVKHPAIAVRGIRGRGPAGRDSFTIVTDPSGNFQFAKLSHLATKGDVASGGIMPPVFTATTAGIVPASGGGTVNFIRADGTWAAPATSSGANPTATASDVAVNGVATTFLRSDGAPAVQKCSSSQFGLAKVDGTTITSVSGVISASTTAADSSIARFINVPAHPGFDPQMIYGATIVLSNNNKTATPASGSPYNHAYGTPARYTGKWYWEVVPGNTGFENIGICGGGGHGTDSVNGSVGNFGQWIDRTGQIGWASSGNLYYYNDSNWHTAINTWAATNVLGFALDIDNLLWWARVGTGNWNNNVSADPATGVGGINVPYVLSGASNGLIWPGLNMGNTSATSMYLLSADFAHSAPTGFSPWGGS
jgi:hypothetical protein